MNSQLYIPEKLKIGFQERKDTYSGKLAYVVYYDQVGKLRKEKGWESWRDKKIDPLEIENKPIDGFVLNKKVGGVHSGWGWNDRMEKVRVYDPRDFEFEISIPNLLFILTECNAIKGKGLEGEFVYAWHGTELILVPTTSQEYKSSKKFTSLQAQKIAAKDLIPGASYLTKNEDTLIYLGRFMWYEKASYRKKAKAGKKHIFVKETKNGDIFIDYDDATKLSAVVSDIPVTNYAELMELFAKSKYASKPICLTAHPSMNIDLYKKIEYNNGFAKINSDGSGTEYRVDYYTEYDTTVKDAKSEVKGFKIRPYIIYKINEKNELIAEYVPDGKHIYYESLYGYKENKSTIRNNLQYSTEVIMTEEELLAQDWQTIFIKFESGAEINLKDY